MHVRAEYHMVGGGGLCPQHPAGITTKLLTSDKTEFSANIRLGALEGDIQYDSY